MTPAKSAGTFPPPESQDRQMNDKESPRSLEGLSAEEMFALAANIISPEKRKENLIANQAWFRENCRQILSGVYYHVTLKCRKERIVGTKVQPGEGLIPCKPEIKHSDEHFDTEGKIHICETLAGDCCSAEHWIRVFSKKDGLPEEAYCVLKVDLTDADCEGYPKAKGEVENLSRNTIRKWSRTLQAAFQRANKNAGKKCVRGVVEEHKLLIRNPWLEFTWIEGHKRQIRQFDPAELVALLDFLKARCPEATAAIAVAKTLLWSWNRRMEVMGLAWASLRTLGGEYHFHIVGKRGIEKWFRIPPALYQELEQTSHEQPLCICGPQRPATSIP